MPYNTRSRRQEFQPVLPHSQRPIRRPQDNPTPIQGTGCRRGAGDLTRESSHTSAFFSLSKDCPWQFEDESQTSSPPSFTRPHSTSPPSTQIEDNPIGIPSPILAFQENHKSVTTEKSDQRQPGQARIIHFDFSKYRPSTPGSESRPIKIEDSPESTLSSSIPSQKLSAPRELAASSIASCSEVPVRQDGCQPSDTLYLNRENHNGSSFMILPGSLELSAATTNIISSPEASTAFLHSFLAAEKYWLRSWDHDMDPDIKFWDKFTAKFNANTLCYQIDTWLTATTVATVLCSQPYKAQIQRQLSLGDDMKLRLVSAIEDCRRMSQRRRRQQQLRSKNVKASIDNKAAGEEFEQDVLTKKPQTLEDQNKLLLTLATTEYAKQKGVEHVVDPETRAPATGLKENFQDKRKRVYPEPHTANLDGPSTRDHPRPNVRRNQSHKSEAIGSDPRKRFKKSMNSRSQNSHSHPSTREIRGDKEGPWSSNRAAQDRLEQRVKELERELKNMRQRRYR
ncbi:hypothetical protein F5Y01DRAFT_27454 [Xylaria sp. FL0043]|nr:hypothetical protein F5Y01DRAFT_27454 [Xylaria sp. FL0043]